MTQKKNNAYHVDPTMKAFCSALEIHGVRCRAENGKVKFVYTPGGKWKVFDKADRTFAIPFHGWTRTVGPKTARETLEALGLYDQFPTYQYMLDGSDALYKLVDKFKEPLRRLKDK